MTPEQLRQLEELTKWKKSLEASHSIPLNVDQAFRARFGTPTGTITTTSKGATSENVTVSEGGVGIYSVLGPPDGYKQVIISGVTYYIPVYT